MEYLAAALISLITSLLAAEFYAHASPRSRRIIEKAVLQIPKHKRARYREEWLAHLEELPGNLGKLAHAFQCYFVAAAGVAKAVSKPRRRRVGVIERPGKKGVTIELIAIKMTFAAGLTGKNILPFAFALLKQVRRFMSFWLVAPVASALGGAGIVFVVHLLSNFFSK